ncbi:MAG: alpha/beta hydrolase [Woeseiaceae bacterium]
MQLPETVEIEAGARASASVIWLHGLGADAYDFEPIVPQLDLEGAASVRFVFPHAPLRGVTINNGMVMRAWYDITSFDRNGPQDESGIRASAELLRRLIEREHGRGIEYRRIVVAGFSQGGAIALHAGLRFPHRLAGIMALSTYLPLATTLSAEVLHERKFEAGALPVFMAHGIFDPVLPFELGQMSRATLESTGFDVEWHEYPMPHAVCPEEIAAIRRWLLAVLGEAGEAMAV